MKPYYDDGQAVIYHGDCREVLPLLPIADLVLTDPPYGSGYASDTLHHKQHHDWDEVVFSDIQRVLAAGTHAVIWGGNHYALPPSRGWLVWIKPDAVPSMASVELAWMSLDRTSKHIVQTIAATDGERLGHPTQKPLRVMRWSMSFFPEAGLILDPFMGTGTTLRAAKDIGRRSIGIEIEERYCEIAAKRLSQETLGLSA